MLIPDYRFQFMLTDFQHRNVNAAGADNENSDPHYVSGQVIKKQITEESGSNYFNVIKRGYL